MKKTLALLLSLSMLFCSCASANAEPPQAPPEQTPAAVNELQIHEEPTHQAPQSITVYVTKSGTKYHSEGCRYLKKSCIAKDLDRVKLTYKPCSKCNPPT